MTGNTELDREDKNIIPHGSLNRISQCFIRDIFQILFEIMQETHILIIKSPLH
jgi:hypothetical protein